MFEVAALRHNVLKNVVLFLSAGLISWLVLYPILIIFSMGFHAKSGGITFENYIKFFTERGLLAALLNSIEISTAVTFFAFVIGFPLAWGVTRTNMPGKTFVQAMVTVAYVVPNFISAIAWVLLLGPNAGLLNGMITKWIGPNYVFNIYSMQGLVLILSASFYPVVFATLVAALENIGSSYEEAARMVGATRLRSSIFIIVPLAMPAIVSSCILVFLESMGAFGAAMVIATGAQFQTITTKIYQLFTFPPQFELAAATATPIIFFTIIGLVIQSMFSKSTRYSVISVRQNRVKDTRRALSSYLFFIYSVVMLACTIILPVAIIFYVSILKRWSLGASVNNITFNNYLRVFEFSSLGPTSIINSVLIAFVTATASVFLGIFVVWLVERENFKFRSLLVFISSVTFAFPGLVLAVGFVIGYSQPVLMIYGTIWLFFIAFTAQRFPYAFAFLRNAVRQLSIEFEDAARISGASWLGSIRDISIPLLKSWFVAAWILVFAVALRELSIAILLFTPGLETLPITILNYTDDGRYSFASALAMVLIIINLATAGAVYSINQRTAIR
jgi:iron(III) transport system permease protein